MKLLIASVLLLGAGVGGASFSGARALDDTPCAGKVEVERLDDDTCEVTCYDEAGDVVCQEVVDCGAPCDAPCSAAPGCAAR